MRRFLTCAFVFLSLPYSTISCSDKNSDHLAASSQQDTSESKLSPVIGKTCSEHDEVFRIGLGVESSKDLAFSIGTKPHVTDAEIDSVLPVVVKFFEQTTFCKDGEHHLRIYKNGHKVSPYYVKKQQDGNISLHMRMFGKISEAIGIFTTDEFFCRAEHKASCWIKIRQNPHLKSNLEITVKLEGKKLGDLEGSFLSTYIEEESIEQIVIGDGFN